MSKTAQALQANIDNGRPNLIGYFPLGYPTLEESVSAAIAMCESGVDVLELGIPYSDPVMDGIVIQEATQEALENGFKLSQTFAALKQITDAVDTPVLVMSYWNPVMQFGIEKFARAVQEAGGAGLITPDLIPDEAGEWLAISDELDLDRVFLATPSSSAERVSNAARLSRGFTYAVSTMGITGARAELDALARTVVDKIRKSETSQLAAVGIGISTTEQVDEVNTYADAAIVGSVFVRTYSEGGLNALKSKVAELKSKQESN
jgi:tryptophan synthase alpha chain